MPNTRPERIHGLRRSSWPDASVFSFRSSLFPLLSSFFALRTLNFELRPRVPHSPFSIRFSRFAIPSVPLHDTPRKKKMQNEPI